MGFRVCGLGFCLGNILGRLPSYERDPYVNFGRPNTHISEYNPYKGGLDLEEPPHDPWVGVTIAKFLGKQQPKGSKTPYLGRTSALLENVGRAPLTILGYDYS